MIEFNTDRMWWTIGAIIVGVLLVTAVKIAFPELLDEMIEYFRRELRGGFNGTAIFGGIKSFGSTCLTCLTGLVA